MKKIYLNILFIILATFSLTAHAEKEAERLPGFKECFGDKPPWEACCLAHDKVYWSGKAVDGYAKRKKADDTRRFEGEVQLVSPNGFSVISDIDDTVKISNVKNRKLLFENTFFKEFREVPGMPDMYQKLAAFNIPIHFVSSSPWQLYDPLQEFLHDAGFPWATLELKRITFENLSKKGTETKPGQIEPIMNRYPGRKFILIGDSGEEDPEVYCDIARRYPNQVHRILIRKVPKDDDKTEADDCYSKAFKNIARSKWQLFDHPDQIAVNKLLSK